MSIKPLQGVRILDFSKVLAGPLCTQALADLGADVVKIEDCQRGDDTRGWPPLRDDEGAVFLYANRSKRSLAIDLKRDEAREPIRRLVRAADVVIESFGPGVPERLGIDYATLSALKPELIYCSISGFGRSGPLAHGKGYDMILQAFTGMVSVMGEPGSGPVRAPYSPVDQGTGMHALSSILAALLQRGRTGEGCQIEVSLFDTGIGLLGYMMQSFWEKGSEPARLGCAHESLCPYQAFQASDKAVLIGVASEPLWRRLCAVLGIEAMAEDPRFATNAARVRNREATLEVVSQIIATRRCDEWVRRLTEAGVPCTQIHGFGEVLSHPHTVASGLVMEYDAGRYGRLRSIGQPVRFNGERAEAGTPPPKLGEQSAAVLAEAGLAREDIARLVEAGVVVDGQRE